MEGLWRRLWRGCNDEPKADGKDALSTGGAYKCIPTNIKVDTETEGVVKLQLEMRLARASVTNSSLPSAQEAVEAQEPS